METYPRCATCKHFDPLLREQIRARFYGTCSLIREASDTPALVTTDEYAEGSLFFAVEPTFGCVLHEPKE